MSSKMSRLWTMLLLLATGLLAAITEQAPSPPPITIDPGCLAECGNKSIPYPFGTGTGCFLPGFEVICDHTFFPPRLFLVGIGKPWQNVDYGNYSIQDDAHTSVMNTTKGGGPMEADISISMSEVRIYSAVSTDCKTYNPYHSFNRQSTTVSYMGNFFIAAGRNVLIGVGTNVDAELYQHYRGAGQTVTRCTSEVTDYSVISTDGPCNSHGCCEASISREAFSMTAIADNKRDNWHFTGSNCSLAMMVEKGWYKYTTDDAYGDEAYLSKKFKGGVPQILHFAFQFPTSSQSCPLEGQPRPKGYVCLSEHSSCVRPIQRPGYFCKCSENYDGNPYIPGGCRDIDECALREQYPDLQSKYPCSSGGVCKNRVEGYDCPCKSGMKGNGKTETCIEILPPPAKVAIGVVGGVSIIVVLVLFVLFLGERKRMKEFFIKNGGPMLAKVNNIKIFKEGELKRCTKNYSTTLGSGAFGVVYKGFLEDEKQHIAVKKSRYATKAQIDQFTNEVIIQSRVIHKNIVKLIGCCLEVAVPLLVYEFVSNGNLEDILHGKSRVSLTMDQRIVIAAESAEGLAYMHSKTSTNIQHGDVKPANILLDDNYIPKISDFGISRLIARGDDKHSEEVIGDNNYMDPVYRETGLLTNKSDVYSFGLVLYELITGIKTNCREDGKLVTAHLESYTKSNTTDLRSYKQLNEDKGTELLHRFAEIAKECLYRDVDQRPEMTDVAERLQSIRKWYTHKLPSP